MIIRSALLSLALCMVASACRADWQYTRWEMTLDELMSKTNAKIARTSLQEQKSKSIDVMGDALAKTTYLADGFKYDVLFYFRSNKLMGVTLTPTSLDDALKINNRLELVYGKPISSRDKKDMGGSCRTIDRAWRSDSDGNVVSFHAHFCVKTAPYNGLAFYHILYQPILSTRDTGL